MKSGDITRFAIGAALLMASFIVVRTPGNQAVARAQLERQCLASGQSQAVCLCAASTTIEALGWTPFIPFVGYDTALRDAAAPGGAYTLALARCTASP